ncbi:F-box only protein 43 [Pholidichthys leucotaenia]
MQCTPESNVYHESCKGQPCYDCSDSGYSGLFHTPHRITGADSCRYLSPDKFETSKENVRLSASPKKRKREPARFLGKDAKVERQLMAVSWCETPRVHKRNPSLQQRLLMSRPTTDVKCNNTWSLCNQRTESSITSESDQSLSESFDSLDGIIRASSTLKLDQNQPLSARKCHALFFQIRTSTLEDGNPNYGCLSSLEREDSVSSTDFSESLSASDQLHIKTQCFRKFLPVSTKENLPSPVKSEENGLSDSSRVFSTPSSTHTPKYIRCVNEDSGFSSRTVDKSQDLLVDHDGSFQELLLSASRGNDDTPNLADTKRHPRLQRQHRLSTLKEGGSQSEEDPTDRKHHHPYRLPSNSKDEVFAEEASPCSVPSVKTDNGMTSNGLDLAKENITTPLRADAIQLDNTTPFSKDPANPDVKSLMVTPVNLSLTPALELVHLMCQHRAQMFAGQSPSLKEQLMSTSSLVQTQLTSRTTMPLAGLIGRKIGLRQVDILTELRKRSLWHVLAVILRMLDDESVYRCGQVCKSWSCIIQYDKQANLRRRQHQSQMEAALEFGGGVHISNAETRVTLPKRSALKTVQVQSRISSLCTPQSGNRTLTPQSGSSKWEKFLEVAKTLFNDEYLKSCPRCEHPARCHSVKGEGVCSRADCAFHFCTSCLCTFHGSKECCSHSGGHRRKDILLPGSAESKRNVRRL